MRKIKISLILVSIICVFSLSCNMTRNIALYLAGLQGQVDWLTEVANPVGIDTPDPNSTPTPWPTPQIDSSPTVEASPTDESSQIIGMWRGTSQWLCDDSAPMETTMDFKSTGSVMMVFTYQGQDPVEKDATWILSGEMITIYSESSLMVASVSENKMDGTFDEKTEFIDCHGVWSLAKQ